MFTNRIQGTSGKINELKMCVIQTSLDKRTTAFISTHSLVYTLGVFPGTLILLPFFHLKWPPGGIQQVFFLCYWFELRSFKSQINGFWSQHQPRAFEMGLKTRGRAAVWDGLHFKIISFADMHEWSYTKYVCTCVCVCNVCLCVWPYWRAVQKSHFCRRIQQLMSLKQRRTWCHTHTHTHLPLIPRHLSAALPTPSSPATQCLSIAFLTFLIHAV